MRSGLLSKFEQVEPKAGRRPRIGYNAPVSSELVYKVILRRNDEGVSAQCPALPGCWSQGADEAEALDNIEDAIREYLASLESQLEDGVVKEVRVAV